MCITFNRQKVLNCYANMLSSDPKRLKEFSEKCLLNVCELKVDRTDCLKLILPHVKDVETLISFLDKALHDSKYFELAFKRLSIISTKKELKSKIHIFYYDAIKGGHTQTCKFLLKNGANPNFICNNSPSPLILASKNQEMVKLLIKSGADVNLISDYRGRTPLYYAVKTNNINFVKTLLKHGADPYKSNESKVAPISWAIENERHKILLEFLAVSDKYKTFQINDRNCNGLTPFLYACSLGCLSTIKILVEKGVYLDDVDSSNQNCFHFNFEFKTRRVDPSTLPFLLEALGDKSTEMLTTKNVRGESPLDLIIKKRDKSSIKEVLREKPELKIYFRTSTDIIIKAKEEGEICLICREIFVDGEEAVKLPCEHLYHSNCISTWESKHQSCPYCFKTFIKL